MVPSLSVSQTQAASRWFSASITVVGFFLMAAGIPAFGQTWNLNANGNWGTAANWTPNAVPNGAGVTATIVRDITAARVITLDINPTIGTLILGDTNNTHAFTIGSAGGAGILTFNNNGAGALLDHKVDTGRSPSGSDIINANIVIADALGLTIDGDRNIEFRGAWNGGGFNVNIINNGRAVWEY